MAPGVSSEKTWLPRNGTIAHGYLTLSLVPYLGSQVFALETPGAKLNYGVNKVRFPSPVRVGSRVRAHVTMGEVTDLPAGKQMLLRYTIEIDGADKPACVAETVVLMTDGENDDPASISLDRLLGRLAELKDPERPVRIVGIAISDSGDLGALERMAEATGGDAYLAAVPEDILEVFAEAVLSR